MTYKIYELKLKPTSSWITDLTADTIFGHLCWQIKYNFGDEVLKKFLKEMTDKPIFTISDVLPADRLSRPLTEYDFSKNEGNKRAYNRNKEFKKVDLININDFKRFYKDKNLNEDNILKGKKGINKDNIKFFEEKIENKNIVNRLAGTTLDNGIYSQNINIGTGLVFSLYIKIFEYKKFDDLIIIDLLKNTFEEIGFGKKKSSGKGNFKIINFENKEYIKDGENFIEEYVKNDGNNILLLSSFIPSENDPTEGNYKLFTKFPKLGEEFSLEGQNFYKKPLVMVQSGATFKNNYKGYVGKMIENMDFVNKGTYHYAYGFTIEF